MIEGRRFVPSNLYRTKPGDLFAFYGLLMDGSEELAELGAYLGDCAIPGELYSVSDMFPALRHDCSSSGLVQGRLWRVPDDEIIREVVVEQLDAIEHFVPGDLTSSMYVRRPISLQDPGVVAWTYVWNGTFANLARVPSGDWRHEQKEIQQNERLLRSCSYEEYE